VRTALTRLRGAWEWYDAIPVVRRIHSALGQVAEGWRRASRWLNSVMPKGLYARALLIIIAPMVILQSVIAFVFMERHWNVVTQRLSASVVQDIAALIDIYRGYPAGCRSGANSAHRAATPRPRGRFSTAFGDAAARS
jgi:two-component system osmolarity sensor histidine kinase EnvZ